MKTCFLAAITAMGLMLTTAAHAQNDNTRQTPQKKSAEEIEEHYSDKIAKELKLDAKQQEQFEELCEQHIKQQRAQREALKQQREEMHKRLQEILTPEQYAQWKQSKCHMPGHKAGYHKHHAHHHGDLHKGQCSERKAHCKSQQRECRQQAAQPCRQKTQCGDGK